MTYTTATNNSTSHLISYPVFEAESKREIKWAARMNCFYDDIIKAAIKHSASNSAKCYIDITAANEEDGICVSLYYRERQQGRTIKSFSHKAMWQRGIIIKKKHV